MCLRPCTPHRHRRGPTHPSTGAGTTSYHSTSLLRGGRTDLEEACCHPPGALEPGCGHLAPDRAARHHGCMSCPKHSPLKQLQPGRAVQAACATTRAHRPALQRRADPVRADPLAVSPAVEEPQRDCAHNDVRWAATLRRHLQVAGRVPIVRCWHTCT